MRYLRLLLGAACLALAVASGAQSFPARPVKLVIPSTPGGSADVVGRAIVQKLGETWPKPVVVENRPGAGDAIGVDYVAKSAPDGYTWLLATNSVLVSSPHLIKLPFDVFADLTPVAPLVTVPFVLVVNPSVPTKSLAELITYAKENPNALNFGSSGAGMHQHVLTELLMRSSGIRMLHVPYKGSSATVIDLISNRVQVYVGVAGMLMPHIKAGKLRVLAIAGLKRRSDFPGVPTIAELVPEFGTKLGDPWLGLFMPSGAPRAIVLRVNADISSVLNIPEVKSYLAERGFDVSTGTPEDLAATLRGDFDVFGSIIREANIKAD